MFFFPPQHQPLRARFQKWFKVFACVCGKIRSVHSAHTFSQGCFPFRSFTENIKARTEQQQQQQLLCDVWCPSCECLLFTLFLCFHIHVWAFRHIFGVFYFCASKHSRAHDCLLLVSIFYSKSGMHFKLFMKTWATQCTKKMFVFLNLQFIFVKYCYKYKRISFDLSSGRLH